MAMSEEKYIPEIRGNLKRQIIRVPEAISAASGINMNGRILKSFMFTTDAAVITNMNADAVIALYPFYPQPVIMKSVLDAARVPVFSGIGDYMITSLDRIVAIAKQAEFDGASGVVVNPTISDEALRELAHMLDIPIILTVTSADTNIKTRLESGATILNVAGAAKTPDIIRGIRAEYPYVPIMATGGPTEETCAATINAGANAITYTPPPMSVYFAEYGKRKNI